jgi:hypothetical protein
MINIKNIMKTQIIDKYLILSIPVEDMGEEASVTIGKS